MCDSQAPSPLATVRGVYSALSDVLPLFQENRNMSYTIEFNGTGEVSRGSNHTEGYLLGSVGA